MGSSLEALKAGYKPANKPTNEQVAIPITTQSQGTTNPVFKTMPNKLPTSTPSTRPNAAPIRLIIIDSKRNC